MAEGLAELKEDVPSLEVKVAAETGAIEVLGAKGTALTPPAPATSGFDIVKNFLAANAAVYGLTATDIANLHFIGESVSPGSGLRMVRVEQIVNGRPVFQSETRFTLDREGRLIRSVGLIVPNATAIAAALEPQITAEAALEAVLSSVSVTVDAAAMNLTNTQADGHKTEVVVNNAAVSGNVPSQLVYFQTSPGVLVPAWSQVTMTTGDKGDFYTLVDASTGAVLWRKNIRSNASTQDARFRVYVQADGKTPADSPAPLSPTNVTPGSGTQAPGISPTIVSMHSVYDPIASPDGWITDGPGGILTAEHTTTIGNNAHAYMDRVGGSDANIPDTAANSVLDGNGRPTGNPDANGRNRDFLGTTPRDFQTNYLPPPQAGNPESGQTATGTGNNGTLPVDQFRRGMITHLFYLTNWFHDQTYALGFDEAAGNFQQTNFSGMGQGNDRVLAEGQDSSGTNNANFSTPPDGQSGRMQMYRFIGPTIDRDGSLDADIVFHELAHGLTNRLIGNGSGLNWQIGQGLGEGWSDFYALSLLNGTNADDPNGSYAVGAYSTYKIAVGYLDNYVYGIRRFPYSTNNSVNPLTWADVDDTTNNLSGGIAADPLGFNNGGGAEVHNSGELWCNTLLEVRSRIIADPAGANGDVPTGNKKMLQLVTDALKMTPISPSFIDARDAILTADSATNGGANEKSIWAGFADRGLGYNAKAPYTRLLAYTAGHVGIVESFDLPYLDIQSVVIDDSLGNNNGALDPNEPVKLTITLKNPWLSSSMAVASATATLSSGTAGVVLLDSTSSYGAIAAQGTATGDAFRIKVPSTATAGQTLDFSVSVTSALLGTKAVSFQLRVGTVTGTGAPITYTRSISGGLAIADNAARGSIDAQTITDDFEIADVDFRVDSLTHPFPGDLNVMLKGPNGIGTDLISYIGGAVNAGGDGDNITDMVIDDSASGDILLATNAQAPYTGSWKPIANSPAWPVVGFGPEDPVGNLSRYNGTSTKGEWKVLVADEFAGDTGTLNSWSLIITPRAYSVSTFVPSSNADLTNLTLSSGALLPVFSAAQTAYTADVSNTTDSITVTPTADPTATIEIQVNGGGFSSVASGSPSGALALNVGANSIEVKVTAQDETTIKSYTITVTRAAAEVTQRLQEVLEGPGWVNNTPATATPANLLNGFKKIHGNIYPAGDVDYYAFAANAGDRVYAATMTSASAGNSTDSQLTLLASDGTTVIEFDDDSGTFAALSSSIAGAVIPASGTYYLKVNDFTPTTGTEKGYDLYVQVRSGTPTEETELNDTPATANLGTSQWMNGARNPATATEQDWYAINLDAGDTVFLSLDLDPEDDLVTWNGRLGFALFGDASNQVLVADDNGNSDTGSTPPTPNRPSEAMFMTVKNTGTYYAFVDSATAAVGGPTATYHLNISVLKAAVESNKTTYTSTDVPKTIGPGTGLTSSTITISGNPRIAKIRVNLNLTHALMTELDVHLRSPAGNDIGLFTDIGANAINGQQQMDITLSDDAAIPPAFTAFRGTVLKPEMAYRLGWLTGENAGGTWTLDIRDDVNNANGGTLNGWSIEIVEEDPLPTGTTIFATDFESGAAGFTHSGTEDEWELGTPATVATATANPPPVTALSTANSGVNCWKTDLDGTYNLGSSQNLDSPPIDLTTVTSGTVRLSWAQWYQMENATFDHAYVEIREVGGTEKTRRVWEWLDATMTDAPGNPVVNIGASAGWALMHADISDFMGKQIQVRFHLDSDSSSVVLAGWAIDDVSVTHVPDTPPTAPEIAVYGKGELITDGDTTPAATDDTDFGNAVLSGGTVARTFTIKNSGDAALTLTGTAPNYVTLSGDTTEFSVTTQPASGTVAIDGETTFVVTFDPTSLGQKNAVVSIASNDADENPYTFAITGAGIDPTPEPVPSTLGDVVSTGEAPGADGTSSVGAFSVLRRGGFMAENGYLVFPGFLEIGAGSPAVTASNNSGMWKAASGNLFMLARTGTIVPEVTGAQFATLPEVPGISEGGDASFLASLVIGSGGVTAATDTGLWSELGGGGLRLLMREDDVVLGVTPAAKVGAFASGVYATATTGATTGQAAFSVTYRGGSTKTAVLRASVVANATTVSVIAQESTPAPGAGSGVTFASLAGNYTDPGRMDAQGNFVFSALTTPGSKEGIWYQPVTGGTPAKVVYAGDTALDTSGATFSKIYRPSIGSNGFITFRATLNANGDNSANLRNDGIWAGPATTPSMIRCILRRGDGTAVVSNLPGAGKVGNVWGGWLSNGNLGAWKAWLDVDGNGTSAAPTDVHALYTNLSGAMLLAVKAGDAAPGTSETFTGFDLPVVGGNNQYAFLGNLSGAAATNAGLWKSSANGGAPVLVLRKGDSMTTTEGSKVITKIDLPGSNQTDRRWEQPVMDSTGRMVVYLTFEDGSTSQILVP